MCSVDVLPCDVAKETAEVATNKMHETGEKSSALKGRIDARVSMQSCATQ
jgi:hypothetical protein